jgi:hypothetical protein
VLEWTEIGGPPVGAPDKPSFGTSIIRDLIAYELGGRVDLALAPEGIRCPVELPSDWLGHDRHAFSEPGVDASPQLAKIELEDGRQA